MRLTTIWTLKGMPLKERLRRTLELLYMFVAFKLVPKPIRYWIVVKETNNASGNSSPDSVTGLDIVMHMRSEKDGADA